MLMMALLVLIFSYHYINFIVNDVWINVAFNVEIMDVDVVIDVGFLIFDSDLELDIFGGSQIIEVQICIMDWDVNIAMVLMYSYVKGDCVILNVYSVEVVVIIEVFFYVNKFWEVLLLLYFK